MSWRAPPWGKNILGYRVLQQSDGESTYEEVLRFTTRTFCKITGLDPGGRYQFQVLAKSGEEHIRGSAIEVVTPLESLERTAMLETGKWLGLDAQLVAEYQVLAPTGVAIRKLPLNACKKRSRGPSFRDKVLVQCQESAVDPETGILMLKVQDPRVSNLSLIHI
eukprot:TRINITY_DN30515_c0_g1_i1.p2 TRINITY_DN30515_c0_g1~~TRINITY_DN30515_c0_g1_i1.p2  ORF type:complete len:164 (+),score=23.87 TRINITY_DN30515_c0_g1_i1:382-873(+)